eukprot:TRINITY_DN1042_c0_g1_i2.p1 TRINITY_DN1042_c0_g1~~TRINITY_DN1042_c0_g1_i2.p1  ORF type:complete len:318 (+),score=61.99 TRINITY_DN1042_c0_g1_i2:136-954(+)
MVKLENITKDHVVMSLIRMMASILQSKNIPAHLVTYDVLPMGPSIGLLFMVPDCITLYKLAAEQGSFAQFIFDENLKKNVPINPLLIRNAFFLSAAIYSIFSYLIDVGDRHLENIMVTKGGDFFHIDYGYVFGEEPALKKPFSQPSRITSEMKRALDLGREQGQSFDEFIKKCTEIYLTIRPHYVLFMTLASVLPIEQSVIEGTLKERFLPDIPVKIAESMFVNNFLRHSSEGLATLFYDGVHNLNKRKPFESALALSLSVVSKLGSFLGGR